MRPPALPGVSIAEGGPNTRNVTAGSPGTPRVFWPTLAGRKPPKPPLRLLTQANACDTPAWVSSRAVADKVRPTMVDSSPSIRSTNVPPIP